VSRTNKELSIEVEEIVNVLKVIESTIVSFNLRLSYLELKQEEREK
jgi:hypothetical protein